jgi:neutral amino acid transport system permease protein
MVSTGLLNALLTGIVTGSIIALGAIGLALVYSIAEVPNFAHGELLTIGAYLAFFVNKPGTVPIFEIFTDGAGSQSPTTVGFAILFVIAAGSVLAIFYHLAGIRGLRGSLLPVDVSPAVGTAINAVIAAAFGGLILFMTPSIWGGILLVAVGMAAITPLLERIIFQKFRAQGVEIATMLIVTLGLSFILRYSTQALYGGQVRSYQIPRIASVLGVEFPLGSAQYFDFYATGSQIVLEVTNTGVPTADPSRVAIFGWSWPIVAVGLAVVLASAIGVGRVVAKRDRTIVPPGVAGALAGFVALLATSMLLGGGTSVPDSSVWSTRLSISVMRGSVIVIALAMMAFLHVLLTQTKLGVAMRASSDNLDLAQVTGINTDRVMMATWIIAGAYAAVGGTMLGVLFSSITTNMGFFLLLPIFAGVILGGIGSVYGAMLGSFVVGISMDLGIFLFDVGTVYRIPFAFVVLFVVLLVKPEGIVGRRA